MSVVSLRGIVKQLIGFCFLLSVLFAVSYFRFVPYMSTVLNGDDLDNILAMHDGLFASSAAQAFTEIYLEKFRPIFSFVMFLQFSIFADWIQGYLMVNLILHTLSASLVYFIARDLSEGNIVIGALIAFSVAISRFALFQTTTVTGIVEGLSTLFFLAMLYCAQRSRAFNGWHWSMIAVLAAALALHTHERYILLLPWLCIFMLFAPTIVPFNFALKWVVWVLCVAVGAFNILYKLAAPNGHFFVGTGGTKMTFDLMRSVDHIGQAIFSLLGFNYGPNYLVGANWNELSFLSWLCSTIIVICIVVLLARGALINFGRRNGQNVRFSIGYLIVLLGALVVLPTLFTIRMEQRWIFQPFIIFLLFLSWLARPVGRKNEFFSSTILIGLTVFALVTIDLMVNRYVSRIYFINSSQTAKIIQRDIALPNPNSTAPLVLISDPVNCKWTLRDGRFFEIYSGHVRSVRCVPSFDEVGIISNDRVYTNAGSQWLDVTEAVVEENREKIK